MKMLQQAILIGVIATPLSAEINFNQSLLTGAAGVFCKQVTVDSIDAPGTQIGRIDLYEETPEFKWDTTLVPAAPGISFGIKTQSLNEATYEGVIITTTHPPFSNDGTTTQTYVTDLGGIGSATNGYSFDFAYEMVPGTWNFRAEWHGVVMYDVDFEVVHPDLLPHITHGCAGVFLS